ncbi:MAG: hypothetical protein CMC08_08725 [Flavobacteriaceae bacterium]|nr:hypothetical protein [Flavobacteriaceae bacterium]
MLTCVNKKIFGMECLGCGIQRATALLFKGEFIEAFKMYPAIYSLMLLLGVVVFNLFIKFRHAFKLKLALIYLNVAIIVVSYIYKMARFL